MNSVFLCILLKVKWGQLLYAGMFLLNVQVYKWHLLHKEVCILCDFCTTHYVYKDECICSNNCQDYIDEKLAEAAIRGTSWQ